MLSLLDMVGIVSVLPFMALLAEPDRINSNEWLARAYEFGGFKDSRTFIIAAGIVVMLLLAVSRVFALVITHWRERFQWAVYQRTSVRLLSYYVDRPYRFFLQRNTSVLRVNVISEVMTVTSGVLSQLITILIQGGITLVIIILLLLVSPVVAIFSAITFGGAYLLIYQVRKQPLARLGKQKMEAGQRRVRTLEEFLQGIKTVKTYGNEEYFNDLYCQDTDTIAKITPKVLLIYQTPRFILEMIAYCGIIGVTLLLYVQSENIGEVLPTLTLFAVAGYRLLPALQRLFSAFATIKNNLPIFERIYPDLKASQQHSKKTKAPGDDISFQRAIEVNNLGFQFPGIDTPLFDGLNLRVEHGRVTAFVGSTGSGKTTLVDLITGLLQPTAGQILIDGKPLGANSINDWRRQLAYVPQNIFLYDASLRDNIKFGNFREISNQVIMEILNMVNLDDFVMGLPDGLETTVGENGIRLSGGQRQRIGMARALLRQPTILVLDEATSSLDNITEHSIIEALENLPKDLTILIIAHRLSTVRHADHIHLLEQGKIVASGTYESLAASNDHFRRMAELG